MQDNLITSLLKLEEVVVYDFENLEDSLHFYIKLKQRPTCCPFCESHKIESHDVREQLIRDIPIHNKVTFLRFQKRRFRCRDCSMRFSPYVYFVQKKSQMTNRLKRYLIESLTDSITFKYVAKTHFVSTSSVLRFFQIFNVPRKPLPEVLCIDEFKGDADNIKYQTALADGKNHTLVDILSSRYYKDLLNYFFSISSEELMHVRFYISDMNKEFKRIKKTYFPKATHIIDKYHFIRQIKWALEAIRKRIQRPLPKSRRKYFKRSRFLLYKPFEKLKEDDMLTISTMLEINKDLRVGYHIAYEFYSKVLRAKDSQEARILLKEWLQLAKQSNQVEWKDCIRAYENWFEEICNSFSYPYTNGFLEGTNNKIKVLKRISYRISSFKNLRNRILLLA